MAITGKLRYTTKKLNRQKWAYSDSRPTLKSAHQYGQALLRTLGKLYIVQQGKGKYLVYILKGFTRK